MQSAKPDARWRDAVFLTIAVWLFVVLMFMPVIIFDRHPGQSWGSILLDAASVIVSIALGLATFVGFRATIDWPTPFRMVVLGIAALAAAGLQTAFDFAYKDWVAANLQSSWDTLPMTGIYEKVFRYLLVFAVNIALFQLATSRYGSQRGERQLTESRAAAQQAQLQALRYQLNPHFLFNTLNSISSLIVTRRNDDAEEMTSKLSSFLRSSLSCDPAALVPLDEEFALTEEYLDIEAVRFGDRLNVEIDCDREAGAMLIPSFLVQPLVENAIKHGVAPSRQPVTISMRAWLAEGLLNIVIENDRPEPQAHISAGTGVGLANVRQRLAAVYGERASFTTEVDDDLFRAVIMIKGAKAAA